MEPNRQRSTAHGNMVAQPQEFSPRRYQQHQLWQQQPSYQQHALAPRQQQQQQLQLQQQQTHYYAQQQQPQSYYSQHYPLQGVGGYQITQQQQLAPGYFSQASHPYYHPQAPPQRRRAADPPAPVQYSESVTGAPAGIELSERQLQILEKRRNKSSPQQSDASSNLQQHPKTNNRPFQTRSNISQTSSVGSVEPIPAVLSSKLQNEPRSEESQRKALRSMIPTKRAPTSALDSVASNHYKDDVGKALLKKVLQQQKSYVGQGSNLREQLRERLHSKRSADSSNSPNQVPSEKRKDTQFQRVAPSTSQRSEHDLNLPSLPSTESRSTVLPAAFVMSDGYKKFMATLQQEVSGQHTHLFAAFNTAVGYDVDLQSLQTTSPKATKLDDQTVLQLQTMNDYLKSTYSRAVECRGKSQLINDKKYAKEQRAMAKKGAKTKPLVSATKDITGVNFREESRKIAIVGPDADDVGRITKKPVTASMDQPSDKNPIVATDDLEVHDVIHVDLQDLPTLSEDPILQTRSSGSVSSTKEKWQSKLKVEIPAHAEPDGIKSAGTKLSAKNASNIPAAVTQKQVSFPPPGVSPVPWIGIQLRSVAETSEAEENIAENTPFWASVNLRPVPRKSLESVYVQDPRAGLAADSPIVVDSESLSARNDFPSSPSGTASCETGPQQAAKLEMNVNATTSNVVVSESTDKSVSISVGNASDPAVLPTETSKPSFGSNFDQPIDDGVAVIRLKTEIANDEQEYRVIIGKKMIRKTKCEPGGSKAVVCWTLPREDMEHDGMTLNMPTLKVTLLLKRGKGSCKVLCFDNAADCLRFASAFYNMTEVQASTNNAMPPVSEISDAASDVDSSVRLESLNDEEQNVLERYRELRQTNSAQDALNETLSLASRSQSRIDTTVSVSASPEEQDLIQKYLKMLQLGAPLGAVQHKMNLDNVPERIHEALIAEAGKSAPPTFVDALPNSPISTFTSSTMGEGEKLNEEEEKIAESYRLLLKRGLPPDAVRHKLTRDNADIKIVHAVFGVSGPAHRSKASSEGGNPQLSDAENIIAEKYRKMLKMGIPADGVRHKMTQDQVDGKIMAALFHNDIPGEEPKAGEIKAKTGEIMSKIGLSKEEESTASQYRKLLKLQIPRDAVLSRMEKEGVSEKIITAVVGPRVASSKPSYDSSTASGCGSTGSNLINLHWNAMDDVPAGSVWEETSKKSSEPGRSDISTLVALFQKKKPTAVKDEKKADAASSNSKAKLLDLTRSNNLAISLKAFREFSHRELADIIGFLDPRRKIRGERAHFIRDLLPTAPEMKIISEYSGSDERLVPAELWFRHLRGIKRLDTKVQVIRTMEMFTSEIKTVEHNFCLLNEVCHQVMGSVKLQDLLGMVLRIGNVMNEGTRTGGAAGFRFDSLLRLTQTKTSDGKITVLDYLVTVFIAKGQRDTLDLESDFPECHTASRFLISDMTNEVKLLKESLEQCRRELKDLERDQAPTSKKGNVAADSDDPRGKLFTAILSRGNSNDVDELPPRPPGPRGDVFAKREAFLAAIASTSTPKSPLLPSDKGKESSIENAVENENSLAGGTTRLRNFIAEVEEPFSLLEKKREQTLEACRDLSTYCGESGGVGSTIILLGVLSEFAKNIESALRKYDNQQENHARKQRTKDVQSSLSVSHGEEKDGKKTSLVLLVSDVLKNANPQFKEDFKKGRTLTNPSKSLKAIYEREKSTSRSPQKLDIVSAIKEREEDIFDDDGLQQHARSTFAGAQQMSPVPDVKVMSTLKQTTERFVSVKNRAALLTSAPKSELFGNVSTKISSEANHMTSIAQNIQNGDSAPSRLQASTERCSQTPVISTKADHEVQDEKSNAMPVSSSPPTAQSGHSEYRTRTPPLPTGRPSRPSASDSKSKERKSLADRARERRLEKKSASRSSSLDERRSAIDGASIKSQTAVARSARENRLQRLSN